MHPLAANEFSKQTKRVQAINNEIKILKPDEMKSGLLVQFYCYYWKHGKIREINLSFKLIT